MNAYFPFPSIFLKLGRSCPFDICKLNKNNIIITIKIRQGFANVQLPSQSISSSKEVDLRIQIYLIKSMKPNFKKTQGNKLIAIVGDEDTVTGFLLTGIGERNVRGETNYLIVDEKATKQSVDAAFNRFLKDANISVVLVTQEVSDKFLRETITQRQEIYPVILEIPSKQKPYDPVKDVVMQRAHRLLYGSELSENS